jgi:hypothetical protein
MIPLDTQQEILAWAWMVIIIGPIRVRPNADNDGLGINYGTSPIECATSNDSGCFWGDSSNQPGGAMITSSDPYKSGSMTLGVNYNSNNDTFSTWLL